MKRIAILSCALCLAAFAGAQTAYDAATIAQKDLNGTARFVGMGGAMGALGGDISTIGTNPAGIGIFRSNDLSFTLSYSQTGTESSYMGNSFETNKYRKSWDNAGIVFATKIGNQTSLRYVNFGFNYHKSRSFYKNMSMAGTLNGLSQTFQMAAQADGITGEMWDDKRFDHFDNPEIGWLSAMGYNGWLISPELVEDNNGNIYENYDFYQSVAGENSAIRDFRSRERGGVNQYDFNISANVEDRYYLGLTIGAYDVDYQKSTLYDEDYGTGAGYLMESNNRITGAGIDVKLGAIFRPFESSPLRIGLAIHSPVFYSMTYSTNAYLVSDLYFDDDSQPTATTVDTFDRLSGNDMNRNFSLQTPWLFNVSAGYTVGNYLALGAEYEYEDYSTMKFRDTEGFEDAFFFENGETEANLKGVHTLRFGAELKPTSRFSIRAGYNYSGALFHKDAYKALAYNALTTDTDFANSQAMNTFTLGLGYRGSSFYSDIAFKYNSYKSDFYAFDDVDLKATEVNNTRCQVSFTLGMRF